MAKPYVHYRNYENHQQQRQYVVFYFYAKEHADYFESLLIEAEMTYERGAGKDLLRRHLFGIHKNQLERAKELNDQTGNFFRKPFLADDMMRYMVLIITIAAVLLGLWGWWKTGN